MVTFLSVPAFDYFMTISLMVAIPIILALASISFLKD